MAKRLRLISAGILIVLGGCEKDDDDGPPGGPPPPPEALGQFTPDGMRLAWGDVTGEESVVLEAVVRADAESGAASRLHVEVVPAGTPFTGAASATSARAASGTAVRLNVGNLGEGDYVWRAWAEDEYLRVSDPQPFLGGAGSAFTVDPFAPSRLGQFTLNGTALGVGSSTTETAVVLKARVKSRQGHLVRARFEAKPVDVPFDGLDLIGGTVVSSGEVSEGTAGVAIGSYHWRVQAEDHSGAFSRWIAFGGNADAQASEADFGRVASSGSLSPTASFLAQYFTDLVTSVPAGGTTRENAIVLAAQVWDPENSRCALEVEVKPSAQPFDGLETQTSGFALSGHVARVAAPLTADSYRWRARALDSEGNASAWTVFGDYYGSPLAVAFVCSPLANRPPYVPTDLRQYRADGVTPVAYGATGGTGRVLKAAVSDYDLGNGLVLEVEVRPAGTPFVNIPTGLGSIVRSGSVASVRVTGLDTNTVYRWQARAIDASGATSTWVEFTGVSSPPPPPSGGGGGGGGGCGGSIAARPAASGPAWGALAVALALLGLGLRPARRGNL